MRESVSVGPPGGKTLMYFTVLLGQSSAARAMPAAIIGAASTPPDNASARRRRIWLVISGDPHGSFFIAAAIYKGRQFDRDGGDRQMPDRDGLGSAWKVTPSRYLATRPAEHSIGIPSSVYVTMPDGCRLAVDVILPDGDD